MSPASPQVEPGCPRCGAGLVAGSSACPRCGLRLVGEDAAALWALDQQLAALTHRRGELLASLSGAGAPAGPAAPVAASGWAAPSDWAGPVPPPSPVPGPPPPPVAVPLSPDVAAGPGSPVVSPYAAPGTAPGPTPGAPAAGPDGAAQTLPAPRTPRRFGAQQLLLVTGVLLVVVAAIAFTAYAWDSIGVLGQAAVLLAVCAAATAGARACARRDLGASAEALAVLAVIVLLVMLGSARSLDVLGLADVPGDVYALVTVLVTVALCTAGDRWLRTGGRPLAPAWAAVLLTAAVPSLLAPAVDGELLTWAAAALVLAVLSVPASPLLARRARGLGVTGLVIGGAHLVLGVLALLVVDVDAGTETWKPVAAAVEFALLAGAAAWLATRSGRPAASADGAPAVLAGRPGVHRLAVVVAYGGVVGALISLSAAGGAFAMLLLALGLSATAVLLLAVRPGLLPWPVLVSGLALAGGLLLSEPVVGSTEGTWWRPAAWYALAAASLLAGQRRPVPGEARSDRWGSVVPPLQLARTFWAVGASLAVFGGSLLAPPPTTAPVAVLVALAAASGLLALSAVVRGAPEWVLVVGWALTAFGATVNTSEGPLHVSVPLAVSGLGALLRAGRASRTAWVVPGVVLLSAAWWTEADRVAPASAGVEWWSLPPALLALAVGVLVWVRHPRLSSWVALGPGLAGALMPSAVQAALEGSWQGEGWRVAAAAVAGALVCGAGVRWSWQAPVVLGAVAALVVAVGQLGPYALQLPTSVGLFAAGALVIVLAVRIEQARRDAARAVGWVRALR